MLRIDGALGYLAMPNQALSELTTLPDSMLGISVYSMPTPVSFRDFKTSPEIIQLAGMLYVRFPLSLRNVEDLVHERCVDVSYESVRYWWHRFGSQFARQIKKRSAGGACSPVIADGVTVRDVMF